MLGLDLRDLTLYCHITDLIIFQLQPEMELEYGLSGITFRINGTHWTQIQAKNVFKSHILCT